MHRFPGLRSLQPHIFAGLLDDPLLLVQNRTTNSGLLFDCGQLHHLAKRLLMGLEAVFVSHAHMDHFMGVDLLLRHLHATPRTLDLFGPPGLAEKFHHKLQGYDWNLNEDFWASFRVTEIGDGTRSTTLFPGPEGFPRREQPQQLATDILYANDQTEVRAVLCEHRIPTLSFRIDERPAFLVDESQLAAEKLVPGPWLGALKRRMLRNPANPLPLMVTRQQADGSLAEETADPAQLYQQIRRDAPCGSIGYIADVGFTADNVQRLAGLFTGLTLLVCECTFLARHRDRARASAHLCTSDLNALLEILRPTYVLPLHLSKRYRGASVELYAELESPTGTTVLRLPEFRTPAPLLPEGLAEREG